MNYYNLISSMLKTAVSSLLTGLYAVYKAESNALASLTTNLYAVYKGESNANDSLGVYNGTAYGGLTYGPVKDGNGFILNGTTSYVDLGINRFQFTGDFTISFWMYPTTISGTHCVFITDGYSSPNERGYRILQRDATMELKIYNNTSSVTLATGNVFSANTMYHVSVVHSATGNKIYINGSLSTSDSATTNAIFFATTPTYIGKNEGLGFSPNSYFAGKIDELYAHSRALTATEVTDLYNSGNGKFYQGNAFYSTIVNDSLGTYNGTAQGGLTYSAGKSGNAFTFNGINSRIDLPTASFNSLTTDFSVSAWTLFPIGMVGGNAIPIFNNMSATSWFTNGGGFWVTFFGLGVQFRIGDKNTTVVLTYETAASMGYNTFFHITVTRSSGRSRIYLNGTLVASNTDALNPVYYTSGVNTTTPTIGAIKMPNGVQDSYYAPLNTKIDELNIWNKELTATEVTDLYNAGAGKFYPTF